MGTRTPSLNTTTMLLALAVATSTLLVASAASLRPQVQTQAGDPSEASHRREQDLEEKGTAVRICRWLGGRKAALSLRFDDSHPTHIERAVPMLNEYGLIGTFLVNPGNANYQKYKEVWEGAVIQQGHELGDHTLTHTGARTDREAEAQIGEPAELLHRLQPDKKLIPFLGGGATRWFQRKSFAFFRAKYHLCGPARGSLSCSEQYPEFSLAVFRRRLEEAIEKGEWLQAHFHPVSDGGHLYISPGTFRELLEMIKTQRTDLWQAGMSAIYQYQQERDNSALWARAGGDDALTFDLTCATDGGFFTQPLTLEVDLPAGAVSAEVLDAAGEQVTSRIETARANRLVRFEAAPVDATYTVRARGIGAAHLEEHGPDLTAPGPHPYLFFTPEDVPGLLEKAKQGPASGMWARLKARADRLVEGDPREWTAGTSFWDNSARARALGLVYALTREVKYAQRALPEVEAVLGSDAWLMAKGEALRTAEAICGLALAYDWLYDALSDDLRKRIREAVIRDGIEPIIAATERGEWWTAWYRCNWGSVIYGQAGVAALALLADDPRAADWAGLFARKIWHYTYSLGPDGGWGESGSYATYAWFRAVLLMDALKRVTGGWSNLFDNPNLPHLAQWFTALLQPDGSSFVPFSNCGRGTSDAGTILRRLAREYRDGHAQWFADRMAERRDGIDVFGFLWCDPSLEPVAPADLPRATLFRSVDWAMLRSAWGDPQAVLFALKGGQRDWDHQHHDTNHFVLYAYGRPLIVDLLYPHNIWGCQTEAHNTIMVNGKNQRGRVHVAGNRGHPDHRGVISELVEAPWYARLVGDASLAYEQEEVKSFMREVMYLRKASAADPPDYFVLFDDLDATTPAQLDWLLHSYGQMAVEGSRITISQDDAAVDVTLVAPERFTSQITAKNLEDAGSEKPFESAQAIRWIAVRPAEPVQRGHFLSVLVPRKLSTPAAAVAVTSLRESNLVGAAVTSGATRDVAAFALDEPKIAAEGITAVGRSCFVRRSQGKLLAAALHNGQVVSADGLLLFETDSSGNAALRFDDEVVEATLDLYDSTMVRLHSPRPPAKVLVNGAEHSFTYDDQARCVRVDSGRVRDLRILFQ